MDVTGQFPSLRGYSDKQSSAASLAQQLILAVGLGVQVSRVAKGDVQLAS